ncbi:MAG: 2-oxo acid dehydrogenase subunit E2 [Sulfitobacter sp.]|nr:2-oxo acid dehydrogenase subunit E2 [Sulfitobacter sp.]
MTEFTLPDLGEGLQDAEIVTWHVTEGDHVVADQPLVSVETDKAVVEIPAPYSGTIARLIAAEGDIVKIGAALVEIDTGQAKDSGAIVGQLDKKPDVQKAAPPQPAPRTGVKATPSVRRLAGEKGVDLATLVGSGPEGAILTRDVEAAAQGVAGVALRGVRRAMARAMTRSHAVVVPATVTDTADISAWSSSENPTVRLIQAMVAACGMEPALNAWFDGQRRQLHDRVDLTLAVDTPDGLFTPVLRDLQNTTDIDAQIEWAKAAVRDRSISPEDMRHATISLSNFGPIGGAFAALVVSPPQVAIVGAGRISEQAVLVEGKPEAHRILPLSLTFDHRAVTGGEAARFLTALREHLQRPTGPEGGEA